MIYYISYIIIIAIQGIYFYSLLNHKENKKKKFFLILSCIELIVFTGIRNDTVGADTPVYVSALDLYSNFNFKELVVASNFYPNNFEFGYLWITKICAFLDLNHSIFLIIIATCIYTPTFRFFYKYSPYPFLSITIYFGLGLFSYSLGIFRQFIAMSVILSGIEYIIQRNLLKWTLIIGISTLFHTTGLICYLIYFLYNLNFKKIFYATVFLQPVLYIASRPVLSFLISFFPAYYRYLGTWRDEVNSSMSMIIVYNMILIACYVYNNKGIYTKNYYKLFINCVPLLCCIQAMAYSFAMLGRAIPYFSIYITIAIPIMLRDLFSPRHSIVMTIILDVLFILLFLYSNIDNQYILPFKFFWES